MSLEHDKPGGVIIRLYVAFTYDQLKQKSIKIDFQQISKHLHILRRVYETVGVPGIAAQLRR